MEHWNAELERRGAIGVTVAPKWAEPLRAAQVEVTRALAPSDPDTVEGRLMALRSCTVLRNESAEEAEASLAVMKHQLAEVPLDILRKACDAYTRAPGTRFFPRASGELFAFINPMIHDRKRMAHRLGLLADRAEAARDEQARLAGDDGMFTLDEFRVIPRDMRATAIGKGWATQAMADQIDAEASR